MSYACSITAIWEPRAETPEALARRFLRLTSRLATIDPVFAHWYDWRSETTNVPLEQNPEILAKAIAQTVRRSDVTGAPVPDLGYRYSVTNFNVDERSARGFMLDMNAGASWHNPSCRNDVQLGTLYNVIPDPRVVTYSLINRRSLPWQNVSMPCGTAPISPNLRASGRKNEAHFSSLPGFLTRARA